MADEDYDECMEEIGDDDAWDETETQSTSATCLFCTQQHESPELVFTHCKAAHNFDLNHVCRTWNLDCFGYIKMVNFIRSKKPTASTFHQNNGKPPWDSDEFMHPVDPEDEMLQYDIEDLDFSVDSPDAVVGAEGEGDTVTVPTRDYEALLQRLHDAETRATQTEESLHRAVQDMENMKIVTKEMMLSQPVGVQQPLCMDDVRIDTPPDTATEGDEDPYFSSYGHFSIHEEMLKDRVRTESYRDFLYQNEAVLRDKVVLDVGCGTGILSMFAARAGAKHVYAVDMAEIIYQAMDIVRENGLADKITFIKGKLEDITLPVEKVDIIISEWMGYFLLFESMLDSVLFARSKYLKHNGAVYPDRCNISIAALSDLDMYNSHVTYWEDVYGFGMECMKACVVREASVEVVKPEKVITNSCILKELDVCTCGLDDLQFVSDFQFTVKADGPITALLGYFDIFFDKDCSSKVSFSTGPHAISTHWKQSVFLLDKPLQVSSGDVIHGKLTCRKNRRDPRSLIITVKLNEKYLAYYME